MTTAFVNLVRRMDRLFHHVEDGLLVLLVVLLAACSLAQIVLREFFSSGILWGDTFLRHGVLWLSFLGAARATSENRHITIDLLPRLFRRRGRFALAVLSSLFSFVVCVVLFWASWEFVQGERLAGGKVFAGIPYWWVETVFPFSFALMALRFGGRLASGLLEGTEP
jgi:TRAP-type C4-dicarboxylate transport system permease small subunit